MVWVDYFIIGIVLLSALISLMRGFVKEALSLATWILAFWVALTFTQLVDAWLINRIDTPSIRIVVAFSSLFVLGLLVGAMVNHFAGLAVKRTGLGGTDRMIGVVFGMARGIVVVAALVLLGILTEINEDPWWNASAFIPLLEPVALWLASFLPAELVNNLDALNY
jgi:membrane protein required for colicin V production